MKLLNWIKGKKEKFPFSMSEKDRNRMESMEQDHTLMILLKQMNISQVELIELKKKYPYKKLLVEKMLVLAQDAYDKAQTQEEKEIALDARVKVNEIKNELELEN